MKRNQRPQSKVSPKCKRFSEVVQLQIEYRSPEELRPNPQNARIHSPRQVDQIAASLAAFGFNIPVLVNSDRQLIAGHGRVEAAKLLGLRSIPVIQVGHLSPAQVTAFCIADNQLASNATWDEQLLAEQLQFLSNADIDFSFEAIGFEIPQVDLLIQGLEPTTANRPDPADEIPDIDSDSPVTNRGDIWALGQHRVLCGDSLEPSSFAALMRDKSAALVVTDAPYNVKINGHVGGLGRIRHREFEMASGEMTEREFQQFLTRICRLLATHSHNGSLHYLFMDWRHLGELLAVGKATYSELKALCIWDKQTGGMGSLYRSQHEMILVYKNGSAPHRNNVQLGRFGRCRTNVWSYPGANSFTRKTSEGNLLALHPTVKPVALLADILLDASARGDLVLDPFLRSGSTLIAAQRTGRVCYGTEINPFYVDTIVRRWQGFTGLSATHVSSGRPFDDHAKEVGNGR